MNCPTADKLSKYTDSLLPSEEQAEIEKHVTACHSCQTVVAAYRKEQAFLEETLKTPGLPEHFSDLVLEQLEPYPNPKKFPRINMWKRFALSAAGIIMAAGLGATFNPSFAQFLGGLFSTDQVDEGLQLAADAGLTKRIGLEVEDQGLTFRVEDVIADSSRVSLSYQVLDSNGKPLDTLLNINESDNKITAVDQNRKEVNELGTAWQKGSKYGFVEYSLRHHPDLEQLTISFNLVELNGIRGNWQLDVPVSLKETKALTQTIDLNHSISTDHGIAVDLQKLKIAPSSTELVFETAFTEEELAKVQKTKQKLEETFGTEHLDSMIYGMDSGLNYHIENTDGKIIYSTEETTNSTTLGVYQGDSMQIGTSGRTVSSHLFVPRDEGQLTFVLDGIYKTEPTDFSLSFQTKEIKKQPISFDYKGVHLTVSSVKKQLFSINPSVSIKMEGSADSLEEDLGHWVAVDGDGNVYPANFTGTIMDEKDKNGRHKASLDLILEDVREIPEQLTLYLVSKRSYYPIEQEWKVPLTERD
ncbi:hypothetical protein HNO89_002455 [Sporosarcina luteola]|nr:hypothetical protein [Sporosarcina luteola]